MSTLMAAYIAHLVEQLEKPMQNQKTARRLKAQSRRAGDLNVGGYQEWYARLMSSLTEKGWQRVAQGKMPPHIASSPKLAKQWHYENERAMFTILDNVWLSLLCQLVDDPPGNAFDLLQTLERLSRPFRFLDLPNKIRAKIMSLELTNEPYSSRAWDPSSGEVKDVRHPAEKIVVFEPGRQCWDSPDFEVSLLTVSRQVRNEALKVFYQSNGCVMHVERFSVFESIRKWSKQVNPLVVSSLRSLTIDIDIYKEFHHVFVVKLTDDNVLKIRLLDCIDDRGEFYPDRPADWTSTEDGYTQYIMRQGVQNGWAIVHWLLDTPNEVRRAVQGVSRKRIEGDGEGGSGEIPCDIDDPDAEWVW